MKATEAPLLGFLKKPQHFVIPIYQRTYSWTFRECQQLWDDILRAGRSEAISVHFIGSIVYIEESLSQVSHQAPLLVIDGQQRLTTVMLILAALANALGDDEPVDGFSARKITNYYLRNPEEKGERSYKLVLSQTDKATLQAIVSNSEEPELLSRQIRQNFKFFELLITGQKGNFLTLCKGLLKLYVVDIALSRGQDNPQLIFESMNSTGRELSQADLIRNFVLMGLDPQLQTDIYLQHWRPMEVEFGQEAYSTYFDAFMRHYLTVKTSAIPRLDEVYRNFKEYAQREVAGGVSVELLVADMHHYARYYCRMAFDKEDDSDLRSAFKDLQELKVDVAYPFLLELYDDYDQGLLDKTHFIAAIRLIESYVFRRAICNIPTNSMNRTFATFAKAIDKEQYLVSIWAQFANLPSYRRFPSDEEFQRDIQKRDLYNFRSRSYWLRRLENYDRKERVEVGEYTIEHIMPQNEQLSMAWQADLGPEWKMVQAEWLHTLGNLTLTGYNSEYADRPFAVKKNMKGGFKESPLRLNSGLRSLDSWTEATIKTRAKKLSWVALEVWRYPQATPSEQAKYKLLGSDESGFTTEDLPSFLAGPLSELFTALRKEVMALDPGVVEEFDEPFVVYKAETNFVNVRAQGQQLRLILNMKFPEINDPHHICRNVAAVWSLQYGDVEVALSTFEELPYVLGLIRQSFELQLGAELVV